MKLCNNSGYITGQRGEKDQINLTKILKRTDFMSEIKTGRNTSRANRFNLSYEVNLLLPESEEDNEK